MNEDRLDELPEEYRAEVKEVRASADRLRLAMQNMEQESVDEESEE